MNKHTTLRFGACEAKSRFVSLHVEMNWRRACSVLLLLAAAPCGCAGEDVTAAVVFDRSRLHTVEITVEARYLEQLATDLDDRVPCTVSYDGEVVLGAGIRQKGNALEDLSGKPSFSIKLDELDEGASLHGLSKILLNSSSQDPTLLRQQIGADMFTSAGLPAARVAHAAVRLNGADKGIYAVVEAIDGDFLRLHFGEGNDEGNLYEGPCCGDFVDDIDRLELDDEEKDGRSRADIQALAGVILGAPDAELGAELDARLRLGQFMTTYAIEAALGHWDGYSYRGNNYYLYDNPADARFVFIPHGMDRILEDPAFDVEAAPFARLPLRIREIPELDARFHAELARVAGEVWDESAVLGAIDQAAQVIRSAGPGEQTSKDLAAFEESFSGFRESLALRRSLLAPEP